MSTVQNTTVKHTVSFDPESSNHNFICHGDKTDSCHNYPTCECEAWSAEHDKDHPSEPHETCWLQDWFDNNGVEYAGEKSVERGYGSEPIEATTGEITWTWEGDYIEWNWVDAA